MSNHQPYITSFIIKLYVASSVNNQKCLTICGWNVSGKMQIHKKWTKKLEQMFFNDIFCLTVWQYWL